MDTEYKDAMNGYDAWKVIKAEGDQPLTQESGKDSTSPKEGGKTPAKEIKRCAMSQNRYLARLGKVNRKKYWGNSREAHTTKVRFRRTRSRGLSVLPAMDMIILLEATMAEHWQR